MCAALCYDAVVVSFIDGVERLYAEGKCCARGEKIWRNLWTESFHMSIYYT